MIHHSKVCKEKRKVRSKSRAMIRKRIKRTLDVPFNTPGKGLNAVRYMKFGSSYIMEAFVNLTGKQRNYLMFAPRMEYTPLLSFYVVYHSFPCNINWTTYG